MLDWEEDENGIVQNVGGDGLRVVSMDQSYCNANHNPGQAKTLYVLECGPESGLPDGKGSITVWWMARKPYPSLTLGGRIVLSGGVLEPLKEPVGRRKALSNNARVVCSKFLSGNTTKEDGLDGAMTNTRTNLAISAQEVSSGFALCAHTPLQLVWSRFGLLSQVQYSEDLVPA